MADKKDAGGRLEYLEKLTGGPMTLGRCLKAIRECEDMSLEAFGEYLGGVSGDEIDEIEEGRRGLSPKKAMEFARTLGYDEAYFASLAVR